MAVYSTCLLHLFIAVLGCLHLFIAVYRLFVYYTCLLHLFTWLFTLGLVRTHISILRVSWFGYKAPAIHGAEDGWGTTGTAERNFSMWVTKLYGGWELPGLGQFQRIVKFWSLRI